jgi:DNA invertase Pin-like site-specific DNA recombinase
LSVLPPNKPPKVGLYARVSTLDRGQDPYLQLDELHRVAEQRGWTVIDEYIDEGVSGRKDKRPELDRMLADARRGRINLIACWRLDRFGRSRRHLMNTLDALRQWGVDFISIRDGEFDTTSATGRLLLTILASIAEFESHLLSERTKAGLMRAKAKGKRLGRKLVEIDTEPALALLDLGWDLSRVARSLGVARNTLRRRLIEAGEWPRREDEEPTPDNRA